MTATAIVHKPETAGGWIRWSPLIVAYARIAPDRLIVRNVVTGRQYEDTPLAALDGSGRIAAIGRAAALAVEDAPGSLVLRRPFDRPAIEDDIDLAARVLRAFVGRTRRLAWWPVLIGGMVVHPDDTDGTGLTDRERGHLVAVARRAGAFPVWVWEGPTLSDQAVFEAFAPPLDRIE